MKVKLDDAHKYITLRDDGVLVCESVFKRDFAGNFKLLMSCIEDNIFDDATIDWSAVERDYKESLKQKQE